jgi:tetratricopeptide (TPR) repeat protein/TolB-like protein
MVALVGTLAALNLGGLRVRLLHAVRPSPNAGTGSRDSYFHRAVAVIGFKNLSGRSDEAWLSTALSEMLTSELAAGGDLRTIPGEDVARMKIELSLPDSDSYSYETLTRIRKDVGTDLVLVGSYMDVGKEAGGRVRLDLRLQDTAGGETLAVLTETGTESEVLDLVSRTGAHLREKLGVGELAAAEVSGLKASYPSNPEAARFYSEGLAKLRKFDALAARPLLRKAIAADPNYALAHSALSEAWSRLGYDRKASAEAKRAFDLSQRLSSEERLLVEGRYWETTHQWDKAVEIYRALWTSSQNQLEYGLRLATAEDSGGKSNDALATVDALRRLPAPARDDPRIDLEEAWDSGDLADLTRAQAAAARAAVKAPASGARVLFAQARAMESWALRGMGRMEEARAPMEDVKQVARETGDRKLLAQTLEASGSILESQGHYDEGTKAFKEALVMYEEIGSRGGFAGALSELASVSVDRGDFAGAENAWRQTLAPYREIGDRQNSTNALFQVGNTRYWQGDLSGAQRIYEQVLRISREIDDRYLTAWWSDGQAHVLRARDDLAGARKLQEASLDTLKQLGKTRDVGQLQCELAETLLEEGRPGETVRMARNAVAANEGAREPQTGSEAHAVLAEGLLAQHEVSEANREIDQALSHRVGVSWWGRLKISGIAARVRAASGQSADVARATSDLRAIVEEARKKKAPEIQFKARLALSEIELASGNPKAGRAELMALQRDASAKGLLLIARKASTAMAKPP